MNILTNMTQMKNYTRTMWVDCTFIITGGYYDFTSNDSGLFCLNKKI